MNNVETYTGLVTSEYAQSTNFLAMISADVSVQVQVQALLESMIPIFDVNVAVGNQLDILGQWIGVSRNIPVPITGIYFTWNGTIPQGWNYGSWQGGTDTAITVLPDDAYRTLLLAKIAGNSWNGTTEGLYAIYADLFPDFTILIQDNENMTYDLAIVGSIPDSLTLALLTEGLIPLKPEGVLLQNIYVPVDTNPLFGWNLDSSYVQGWNDGSWASIVPVT